jgi:maleylpyruvate isomerase
MTHTDSSVLYGYFRSTAAYRVRIALALKGLTAENRYVHLRKGEQTQKAYRKINPAGLALLWQIFTIDWRNWIPESDFQ